MDIAGKFDDPKAAAREITGLAGIEWRLIRHCDGLAFAVQKTTFDGSDIGVLLVYWGVILTNIRDTVYCILYTYENQIQPVERDGIMNHGTALVELSCQELHATDGRLQQRVRCQMT